MALATRAVPVVAALALAGCGMFSDKFEIDGVVRYSAIEGGCWVIRANNRNYEPSNLPAEFRQDSLAVRATVAPRDDLASFCQMGPIVEIRQIERR